MFDGSFRKGFDESMAPWGARLGRLGVTPNALTGFGLLAAAGCSIAIASGWMFIGFLLFLLSVTPDILDGAVARATKAASSRGAFFDSVADRFSDSLYLFGMAWYMNSRYSPVVSMLPVAVMVVAPLIPYQRAKAESLGFHAKGGLMERAERSVLLGLAMALPVTMPYVLAVLLVLAIVTNMQRFLKVWKQASANVMPRRRIMVGTRWENWRTQYVETLQARRDERMQRRLQRREARGVRSMRGSRRSRP